MSSWRSTAERCTHRLVLRRRLPPPFQQVRIHASSEGGLRYLKPRLTDVDPTLLSLVSEVVKPGAVVWDVGANLGLFSFASAVAAGPSGRVLAIEPDSWLVALLRRSAVANTQADVPQAELAPVEVLPVAVSDSFGVGRFHIARRNRSTSHLEGFGSTQTGGTRSTELVPTVTLDWLATHFPPPDVIKIDVEAAEALVLQGGPTILARRPVVICEVVAANATLVRELLQPHGYVLYDGELPTGFRRPLGQAAPTLLACPLAPVGQAQR
ncbi:MAG: FkbM family methyltransferase [Streptomycetales bacterium]